MNRRSLWILIGLVAAFLAGRFLVPAGPTLLGATPALASSSTALQVKEGHTFVTAGEGTAYLWEFVGGRIGLLGVTQMVEGADGQAHYIWMPGVERRK
jgi:hypothetical protein